MRHELIDEYIARIQVYRAILNLIRVLDKADAPHEKRLQARVESLAQYETLDALFDRLTFEEVLAAEGSAKFTQQEKQA